MKVRGRTESLQPAEPRPPEGAAAAAFGLTKTYGTGDTAVPALRGVTVHFGRGTFTAVMWLPL